MPKPVCWVHFWALYHSNSNKAHLDTAVSENTKAPHELGSNNDNLFSLSDAIRQLNKPHTVKKKSEDNF